MMMEGGSDEPVIQHNRERHRSDLGSSALHGSRYGACAAAAQEAARCATRQLHA